MTEKIPEKEDRHERAFVRKEGERKVEKRTGKK